LEGLLEVVGLELMAESIMVGTHSKNRREREFKILGAATLKLREPNEVRTNGAYLLAYCLLYNMYSIPLEHHAIVGTLNAENHPNKQFQAEAIEQLAQHEIKLI